MPLVYRMSHLMFAPFLEGNPDNDSQSSSDRTVKNCLLQKGYEHTKNTLKYPPSEHIHPTLTEKQVDHGSTVPSELRQGICVSLSWLRHIYVPSKPILRVF